ncbi:saccharopine dehydrogenase family protein [Maritalea sp.]|jgi:saccharopine dehydrogenase-like NADP-dependent oxidoreductase|uniref:saccharopine dehydrogenase family protein n=1 Tax=Maritalea sp. TaxID=2003361 RepID=UPI0039E30CB9
MNWEVLIVGGGNIGRMVAVILQSAPEFNVTIADADDKMLEQVAALGIATKKVDVGNEAELLAALAGKNAVLSAAPYFLTPAIATAAKKAGANYFDLTEDVKSTKFVMDLAKDAKSAFMPQCGLAPGFVGIAGYHLAKQFDTIEDLSMRVGALPRYPTNALKYNLTWSTEGLVNEYCNPCEALVDGQLKEVAPLENLENFSLDGIDYEAFNTSGGLGTLCDTLAGRAQNVSYRSIRYPGHRDILNILLNDLKLNKRQDLMCEIFENGLPRTRQDQVTVFCTATGMVDGQFEERSFVNVSTAMDVAGHNWSAIQITTAAGVTAAMDLMRLGRLPQAGFVRQEQIDLDAFLANRFGALYLGKPFETEHTTSKAA